ncbi:MAG: signal peptidase Serine peptidase [Thermoleophilia bacterium]|nr:signal peptidase Serine peptidase [Thermoleophilia bacterium]
MSRRDRNRYDDLDDEVVPAETGDGRGSLLEVIVTIGAALLLAFVVQQFLVKPFKIPSGSMENTLKCGDRVLVDRLSYRFHKPHRTDVVVFNPPAGVGSDGKPDPSIVAGDDGMARRDSDGTRTVVRADTNYIKRVIGLPGDRVQVKLHKAYINGRKLDEPYLHPLRPGNGVVIGGLANWGPATVPKDTYLMLGDHRDNSADGRVFGFLPRNFIVGKAFMVYWPLNRFGKLPAKDPGGKKANAVDENCLESAVPAGQT